MQQTIAAPPRVQPLGKPGALADIIVAVLSLATIDHGLKKVSSPDFYRLFQRLIEEFPRKFPPITFERSGRYVYSKVLGDALERALRLGVQVMNPRFLYLGIEEAEDAQRNLELIGENTGKAFIENLRPVADRLVNLLPRVEVGS